LEGAARDGRGEVLLLVDDIGELRDVGGSAVRFVLDRRFRARRDDEMELDRAVLADGLDRADAVDRARRAGDRDDDAARNAYFTDL
jgi:hypothetical protein